MDSFIELQLSFPMMLLIYQRISQETTSNLAAILAIFHVDTLINPRILYGGGSTELVYSGKHVACNNLWLHATDIPYDTLCYVLPATLLHCCSNKVA